MKTILKYFIRFVGITAEWLLILILFVLVGFGSSRFQTRLVNYVAENFLNDDEFYLKAQLIDVGYDGSIHVEGLQLYLGSFHIDLDQTRIDVQLSNAIGQRFIGDSLFVDGLKMTVLPHEIDESDTSHFEFKQIPYCKFSDVSINNTSLYLAGYSDVDTLLFPYVHASNLIFNDSILMDSLIYNSGKLVFVNPVISRGDTLVDPTKHLVVPSGVPKFHVASFEVNDLYFNTYTEGEEPAAGLKDIDFALNGWNNTGGADISLKYAGLTVQDSIRATVNSEKLILETDKELHVEDLKLHTSWVDLDLNTFDIFLENNDFNYAADITRIRISPEIQALLPLENDLFRSGAPDVTVQFRGAYEFGSLDLNSFDASFGKGNDIHLSGSIGDVQSFDGVNLNADRIDLSINELKKYLSVEALDGIPVEQIHANLMAQGRLDDLQLKSGLTVNKNRLDLSAHLLNITQDESRRADVNVRSPHIQFGELLGQPENDLELFATSMFTSIELNENIASDRIDAKIMADSLVKGGLTIPDIDCLVHLDKDSTMVHANSGDGQWFLNAGTYDNIFSDKTFHLKGDAKLSTLNVSSMTLINGQVSGLFNGVVGIDTLLNADLTFEDWIYESDIGHRYDPVGLEAQFAQELSGSKIALKSQDLLELSAVLSDSLTSSELNALDLDSIPRFAVYGSMELDSTFMHEFFGLNLDVRFDTLNLSSVNNVLSGEILMERFSYDAYHLDTAEMRLVRGREDYAFDFLVSKLETPFESVNDFVFHTQLDPGLTDIDLGVSGDLIKMGDHFGLRTFLQREDQNYTLRFEEEYPVVFGERRWVPQGSSEVFYNGKSLPTGNLVFANGKESVALRAHGETASVKIDSFDVYSLLKEFSELPFTEATLFTDVRYDEATGEIMGNVLLDEIAVDSIRVGDIRMDFDADNHDQTASLQVDEAYGKVNVLGRDLLNEPELDASLSKLDLSYLTEIGIIDTNTMKLEGVLDGEIHGKWKDNIKMKGYLNLDHAVVDSKELGVYAGINGQRINITDEAVDLTDLIITDRNGDSLVVLGDIKLSEEFPVDVTLKSERFKVIDNHKSRKDIKGDISMSSDLKVKGNKNGIEITGELKTMDNGYFDYYYESTVALEDNENVVRFISNEGHRAEPIKRKTSSGIPISYNVDLTLGSTNIYVLLSKTSNEYFKMKGAGGLSIVGKNGAEPQVFGTVSSLSGHVYYELPVVSTIQLDIIQTHLLWNGELGNPTITFEGEELFMITPNEISAQMDEKRLKVPVVVSVQVPQKPLEDFELAFDIRSGNQEIQDLFASLPTETKTNYALDLLTFGKINRDSEVTSSSSSIVDKMNEISRRNLKDADLRFSYDSYASDDLNSHSNVKSFGYSYSKNLLEDKLRITIGGALNWGGNGEEKSSLFGDVALEYVLREAPDVSLNLKKANVYNGPIEGQTTVSSAGVEFKAKFKNLFRKRKKLSTDEIQSNE